MNQSQIILITGASSGMGKETALRLIAEGHIVYGAARRVEKMLDLVEAGGHVLLMDVTDEAQVQAGIDRIIAEQGRIDVLVNNAGYGSYGSVEETPIDDARRQFDVNLFGLARLTQLVIPHMRERQSGKIINISSVGGKIYTPLGAWYHATKHALEGWSDCLRLELKPFGIDVVIVEPGLIATEFGEVLVDPMLERSGEGPYQGLTKLLAQATKVTYEKKNAASPPSVIADTISGAIRASRPRTRYAVGKLARPLLFFRNLISDRMFDRLIMSQVDR
ncbi:MAG: oxidoreductase [Saprospiraceae bacterium]|nr:oxidoreductase [Saprospiraceae bacterium]MCB0682759.1 oxidoreductase [Saprospiraceae bacterium]